MPYTHDPDALAVAPEGTYPLTITAVKDTFSKKGDPMFIIQLEDDQGRELAVFAMQTPKGMDWKFKPVWKAAGFEWSEDKETVIDEQDLVDCRILGTVKHEKTTEFGLKAILDGAAPMGTEQLGDAKEFETAPASKPESDDDDDIPF